MRKWGPSATVLSAAAFVLLSAAPAAAVTPAAPTGGTALPITARSWVWSGLAQHPFATQHPDLQYVAAGAYSAHTLISFDVGQLGDGSGLTALELDYPASNAAEDGAYASETPRLQACLVTSKWEPEPAGRPREVDLTWDCELATVEGELTTVEDATSWRFDLLSMSRLWLDGRANHGVVLTAAAVPAAGWSVPLVGDEATVTAVRKPAPTTSAPSFTAPGPAPGPAFEPAPFAAAETDSGLTFDDIAPLGPQEAIDLPLTSDPSPVVADDDEPAPAPPTTVAAFGPALEPTVPVAVWIGLALLAGLLGWAGTTIRAQTDGPVMLAGDAGAAL